MAQADLLVRQLARGCLADGRQSPQGLLAHTESAAALAGNPTHLIESANPDSPADRLDRALSALRLDVQIPGCSVNRRHLNKLFVDLQSEAVAVIRNASEELRNHGNWKVS
jgi:hypothetical protein